MRSMIFGFQATGIDNSCPPFGREMTGNALNAVLRAFESVRFHDFQIVRFFVPYANCRRA
jgi:hypothetical protein